VTEAPVAGETPVAVEPEETLTSSARSFVSPVAELAGGDALPLHQPDIGGYLVTPAATETDSTASAPEESAPNTVSGAFSQPWRYVGEVLSGYLVVEEADGIVLIDKHAAHERIRYNQLKENQSETMAQVLLTPLVVTLPPALSALLLTNTESLADMGFNLEEFGNNSIIVREAPTDVDIDGIQALLGEIAERLREGRKDASPQLFDDIMHMIACHSAIRLGHRSQPEEAEALASLVMGDASLRHCPHGRPISVSLSRKDITRQFKRT
jgi:DNA mismatch repair protein MutL